VTPLERRWTLGTAVDEITPVVDDIVALCRAAGFSRRQCQLNVPVAVTEAIANAMLRGNQGVEHGTVDVMVQLDAEQLIVDVRDDGAGFDLAALMQSPDEPTWLEREDGRGVFLMRQLMDAVENRVERADPQGSSCHCLRLVLHRA
jgi:serine/threonine-protein kinase RsbW